MSSQVAVLAPPGQNAFFRELAEALVAEMSGLGAAAELTDGYPGDDDGRVHVLVGPHEYAALHWWRATPSRAQLARTVAICTEQPGTKWFDLGASVAARAGAVLDINRQGVRTLLRRGIRAGHAQLGHTASWEPAEPTAGAGARSVDIAFLGGKTDRRCRILAGCGDRFRHHRCHLIVGDNSHPNPESSPVFVAGEAKRKLLGDSKVLLNIHRDDRPYFEWQRVLEAICAGAVVVTEHARDHEPLVPGEHLLAGRSDSLAHLCDRLLADPAERDRVAGAALDFIRSELPMSATAERVLTACDRAATSPRPSLRRALAPARITIPAPEQPLSKVLDPLRRPNESAKAVREIVKQTRLEMLEMRRRMDSLDERIARGGPPPRLERVATSGTYGSVTPDVSVAIPLYNQGTFVTEALDSVAGTEHPGTEVVVIDDGSTDGSGAVAREWIEAHPAVPAVLCRHPVNRGLAEARNSGAAQARAGRVLFLDSDNTLYPHCVDRLSEALDADPEAAFAYGILEVFDETGPVSIHGHWGWDPQRLARGNYIDALAMIRREALESLGGFPSEPGLHGWEDYDLWCQMADRGMHAAHVPEIVARYRKRPDSMLQLTNISWEGLKELVHSRHPELFAGAGITADGPEEPGR